MAAGGAAISSTGKDKIPIIGEIGDADG